MERPKDTPSQTVAVPRLIKWALSLSYDQVHVTSNGQDIGGVKLRPQAKSWSLNDHCYIGKPE